MPIPASDQARPPILEYLAQNQGEMKLSALIEAMAKHFEVTEAEKREIVKTGMRRFDVRITAAVTNMKKHKLVEPTRHGYIEITPKGIKEANKTLQAKKPIQEPTPASTPTPAAPVSDEDEKVFQEILKTYLANNNVKPEDLPQVGKALREMLYKQ